MGQLTFEQISPKWASVLLEGKPTPTFINYKGEEKPIDIVNGVSCVVGEAHGFDAKYIEECKTCVSFASKFVISVEHNRGLLYRDTTDFTRHWNEFHAV